MIYFYEERKSEQFVERDFIVIKIKMCAYIYVSE